MTQREFDQLLKRYLQQQTTAEEDLFLMEWYQDQGKQPQPDTSASQRKDIEKRMWTHILREMRSDRRTLLLRFTWLSAAAVSLMILASWLWLYPRDQPQSTAPLSIAVQGPMPDAASTETLTTALPRQAFVLPDGSRIILTRRSRLTFNKSFDAAKRQVYLEGDAYFDVRRDPARPFVVYAGGLVTEVLGTRFFVRQRGKDRTTQVSVREGKVSVYAKGKPSESEQNGVIITQNQQVVFDETSMRLVSGLVAVPVPLVLPDRETPILIFQEAELDWVLAELSRLYGIEFVVSSSALKNCRITADLNGLTLFTQLDLVCKSIGARYDKRGTVVFVEGSGC